MSDNLPLGKKNPGQVRDAFHVPVMTVILGEWDMKPGDHVVFHHRRKNVVVPANYSESIGIIDPYIQDDWLGQNDEVLLWLKPGMVTGMQHRWKCPVVDQQKDDRDPTAAETWLEDFADKWGFDYQHMIALAKNPPEPDKYGPVEWNTAVGRDLHNKSELGDDYYTFWEKIEELNGKKYDEEHRNKVGWSCTC
jgi:hypothetical protein